MKRRATAALLVIGMAALTAGCMSGGNSDRSSRKAALGSTTSGDAIGSMDIAGVASGIDIYEFSWGAQGGGNPHTNGVTIMKKVDPVSGNLLRAALQGQALSSVRIELFPVGARPFATYELTTVQVEAIDQSGPGDEQVALTNAGCLAFTPTGGTRVGWENARARSC